MDLRQLLDEQQIDYIEGNTHRHVREGWIGIQNCPFCGSDVYHLGINLTSGAAACWRCGRLSLVQVLSQILRVTPSQAYRLIKGVRFERYVSRETRSGKLQIPKEVGDLLPVHKKYLKSRGLEADSTASL